MALDQHGVLADFFASIVRLDDGHEVGSMRRRFSTVARRADHQRSEVYEAYRSQGIGRRVMSATIELYDLLGIRTIHLSATEAGRYFWAMCGFDFDPGAPETDRRYTVEHAEELARRLGFDLERVEHTWEIAGLRQEVPLTLLESVGARVSDLGRDAGRETVALGKALLVASNSISWEGRLLLDPKTPERQQADRYLREE